MILFVFEGERRELEVFHTMWHLYFPHKMDKVLCSFGNNIFNLYKKITDDGRQTDRLFYNDIISIIREKEAGNEAFSKIEYDSQISEVYLFFDFDLHNSGMTGTLALGEKLQRIKEMLEFFSDETDQGKLYINYPMLESLRYTKALPDPDYWKYECPIANLNSFKKDSAQFSFYPNMDFVSFRMKKNTSEPKDGTSTRYSELALNWSLLVQQNLKKSNYICNGEHVIPEKKESVDQIKVFDSQKDKFIPRESISILNSFPLFLLDYFEVIPNNSGMSEK